MDGAWEGAIRVGLGMVECFLLSRKGFVVLLLTNRATAIAIRRLGVSLCLF